MLNPVNNDLSDNVNKMKDRLNRNKLNKGSDYIIGEGSNEADYAAFIEEEYKVKDQLKYKINNFDINAPIDIKNNYSI
ncbi:hypothetical protein [Proteus hauseri]|uniref:hypothetical protein n=1 Tax=Proteus hauseri TaxID=183417 RepID=UPI0010096BD7|nr:hypothetical protein [Proteus hauseri]QAV22722.1 hypothetical protein PH4a_04930 [Proteus hauseri]